MVPFKFIPQLVNIAGYLLIMVPSIFLFSYFTHKIWIGKRNLPYVFQWQVKALWVSMRGNEPLHTKVWPLIHSPSSWNILSGSCCPWPPPSGPRARWGSRTPCTWSGTSASSLQWEQHINVVLRQQRYFLHLIQR